jgi:pyrimidine operon attenuation protein/uracil phosphoribosyltransferase
VYRCVTLTFPPPGDAILQTREKVQLLSASELDRTLVRLAHEVLERTPDVDRLAFVGIRRGGVPLAQRLARKIGELEERTIPVGSVGIQHYRDDLSPVTPEFKNSADIPFELTGKDVVLVDDVLHTGRTVRAGLEAMLHHGRPARVQLLVLVDRGHRELPIEARYVGRIVQTKASELVIARFQEIDGEDKVVLAESVNG